MNRSRLLLAAGFVTAVAAGTLLTPASVCATSGGCFFPSFAVSQYLSQIGSGIESTLSENRKRCNEQCDEMFNGCTGVAAAAERCVLEAVSSAAGAQEYGCNDLGKPESGDCKRNTRGSLREFIESVKGDKRSALLTCDEAHEACHADCEGGGKPE